MKRSVFRGIVAAGFVWPWALMVAVDGYLGTGRVRNFFAVYTDTPLLYLLLFVSQALWSAVPFVAFALFARRIFTPSSGDAPADSPLRRTSVIAAGLGALALFSGAQAAAWKEYFVSPSGTSGIAIALAAPPLFALLSLPILYGVSRIMGKYLCGGGKRCVPIALAMLLAAGCSSRDGRLLLAASNGNTGAVKALLGQGADVNARGDLGQTALYYAAWMGQTETVQVLLDAGADANAGNIAGGTALMGAAWSGRPEMAQALLAKGADVNTRNSAGGTALMIAVTQGHASVAQVLLGAGADMRAKNNQGMTALALAVKSGRRDIAELLVRAGARE